MNKFKSGDIVYDKSDGMLYTVSGLAMGMLLLTTLTEKRTVSGIARPQTNLELTNLSKLEKLIYKVK